MEEFPDKIYVKRETVDEVTAVEMGNSDHTGCPEIFIGFTEPGVAMESFRDNVMVRLAVYELIGYVDATKSTSVSQLHGLA